MVPTLVAVALAAAALVFTLWVRREDIPEPLPASPTLHLEERKARIYENLRDLQFEFRLGKLSDADYQKTKLGLQRELSVVLAELDSLTAASPKPVDRGVPVKIPPKLAAKTQPALSKPKAEIIDADVEEIAAPAPKRSLTDAGSTLCPYCGATFAEPLKFCGECGKAMV